MRHQSNQFQVFYSRQQQRETMPYKLTNKHPTNPYTFPPLLYARFEHLYHLEHRRSMLNFIDMLFLAWRHCHDQRFWAFWLFKNISFEFALSMARDKYLTHHELKVCTPFLPMRIRTTYRLYLMSALLGTYKIGSLERFLSFSEFRQNARLV
jgi:hypothetical protein